MHRPGRRTAGLVVALALATACSSHGDERLTADDPTAAPAARFDPLPPGFVQTAIDGLGTNPTGLRVLDDGRVLVIEHHLADGDAESDAPVSTWLATVSVVRDGVLLDEPMLEFPVAYGGEQLGAQDIAVHPTEPWLYVSHTAADPVPHNRVSRFRLTGDHVEGGPELVFELPPIGDADSHFGGGLTFGSDGLLYWAVGDHYDPTTPQRLDRLFGKLLRLRDDGTIPHDNPFVDETTGVHQAIYALGLRNPWKMARDRTGDTIHVHDVGAATWEEVNVVAPGANYGWPVTEGPAGDGIHTDPVRAFHHTNGSPFACAIAGGDFYSPDTPTFPDEYVGDYLVGEFCNSWIYRLDPETGQLSRFSDQTAAVPAARCDDCGQLIDLKVAPDGDLWQLHRLSEDGAVTTRLFRTSYRGDGVATIGLQPDDVVTDAGGSARFDVVAFGTEPLSFQWRRDGIDIDGAESPVLVVDDVERSDDGAEFSVAVTNDDGTVVSDPAELTVADGSRPSVEITAPVDGSTYRGGQTIEVIATADDADDGELAASAFSWSVDLHHDEHAHPFVSGVDGVRSTSFEVPTLGETSTNVWYRVHVTVTDSDGLQAHSSRDIHPELTTVRLDTDPTGLMLALDGQPVRAPVTFDAVVGVERVISAPARQDIDGAPYVFDGWTSRDTATTRLSPTAAPMDFTASYAPAVPPPHDASAASSDGFVWFTGAPGDRAQTEIPEIASADLRLRVALADWTPEAPVGLTAGQNSNLGLSVRPDGGLELSIRTEPNPELVKVVSTAGRPLDNGAVRWLRATYDATTGSVEFFISDSSESDGSAVDDWQSLGDAVSSGTSGPLSTIGRFVAGSSTLQSARARGRSVAGRLYGVVVLDARATVSAIDFSDADDVTTIPPDYSGWGDWVVHGQLWEYIEPSR